jgi:hypothetical protein
MRLEFRKFVERLDATSSVLVSPTHTFDRPPVDSGAPTGTFVPHQPAAHDGPVADLVAALTALDPFLLKRGHGYAVGTINYMSPEMSRQPKGQDDDELSHFYFTLQRTHPESAALLRPVLPLFRRFHALAQRLALHRENVEMAFRMDVEKAKELMPAVERVRTALAHLPPAATAAAGAGAGAVNAGAGALAASYTAIVTVPCVFSFSSARSAAFAGTSTYPSN